MTPATRYVFAPRVQCPECHSPDLQTVRSMPIESDGSRARYTHCRACAFKFVVVVELKRPFPKYGKPA